MSKRGRPPHPDILTPREWEVLDLVRDGLSNEEIAGRLGISVDGVKYHVSEILSKLGLENRHDAARWQPTEERPWWATAVAPLLYLRRMSFGWLSPALAGGLAVIVAAGIGLLVWALLATRGDGDNGTELVCVERQDQAVPTPADGIDRSIALFQAEERMQCGVVSVCVDGAGGIDASDTEVELVRQALDTALAGATHIPGADTVPRRVVEGCPPPLALTGQPKSYSAEVPMRWLGPTEVPSPHVLFVYFVGSEMYRDEFHDLPDFVYFTGDAERRCDRDIGGDPANLRDGDDCSLLTQALYLPPSPDLDALIFTLQVALPLVPPGQIPTPDWHACELGTPEPWCDQYHFCSSADLEATGCDEFWEDIGMEPPQ